MQIPLGTWHTSFITFQGLLWQSIVNWTANTMEIYCLTGTEARGLKQSAGKVRPFWGLWGRFRFLLLSWFLGVCWQSVGSLAWSCITPVFAFIFTWHSPYVFQCPKFPFLIRTPVILDQCPPYASTILSSLNELHPQWRYFHGHILGY